MKGNEPTDRVWNALKRRAHSERGTISPAQAIKRVKAVAKSEGAVELPDRVLRFYADEYCDMVSRNKER